MALRLDHMPTVKVVMTPFPYSVDIDDPVALARELMNEHRVRHLPVKEHGRLTSVVTDRDLKFVQDPALGLPPSTSLRVRNVCVFAPYIVDLNDPLDKVLAEMAERSIGSAIVTRKGDLAGIMTTVDVCRYFGRLLKDAFPPEPPDRPA